MPVKWTHRKMVVSTFTDSELFFEIVEGIEAVRSIEFFVVLSMRTLDLAIVTRRANTNQLVPDAKLTKRFFKKRFSISAAWIFAVGKFRTIVCLDALNGIGKTLCTMPDKHGRRIGAVLLKGFQIAEAAEFVNERVLIPFGTILLADDAHARDEFDVDLDALTGILHLLVGLWDVFWIWQRCCHLSALAQKAVESGNGSGITALSELYPEHDDAGIRVPAPHIEDELDLLRRVLVWMAVRAV